MAGVEQAALLRELFGNPFDPVAIRPEWRTDAVVSLSREIQVARAFELLPVLGDALQDAVCEHPEIIAHCYGSDSHKLGCWLIDAVLGRV